MIRKIPAKERFYASHDWLSTYHLFSFADYYDPENMNFGILRVFNDDTIDAHSGFGAHSHRDMEIVTIVLEGELTHKDSMGNAGKIKAGEVQYMSAGIGVTHAELNESDVPVHLYQIWIEPKERGLIPSYEQKDFSGVKEKNVLVPLASGNLIEGTITLKTDATIYTAELEAGKSITHPLMEGYGAFIYIREGSLAVDDIVGGPGDQVRIEGPETVVMTGAQDAAFIFIEALL
jgi:quercetin 2,3-dioxygenase